MDATEQHYTPQQVATMWGISADTVRRLFEDDPAVLKISMPNLLVRKRRPKISLRIPASALARVHHQQTRGPVEIKRGRRSV